MISFEEVLRLIGPLEAAELELWVEQQWVRPERRGGEVRFAEIDLARIRLIHDIRHTLEVPEETVPVMLSLIDQLYTMRRQMRGVMNALETLSPEARQTVLDGLEQAKPQTDEER